MKIRAAVVREKSGPFVIDELELNGPGDDEVLVRLASCGICRTDLDARDGNLPIPLPAVFGHEGAGVVEKTGSRIKKVKPGDAVVLLKVAAPQEVKDYVKRLIDEVGQDGGYILTNGAVLDEANAANLHALIDFGKEYGVCQNR